VLGGASLGRGQDLLLGLLDSRRHLLNHRGGSKLVSVAVSLGLLVGLSSLDLLESLGGDSIRQEVSQVIVVDDPANVRASLLNEVRLNAVGMGWVLRDEFRNVPVLRLDSLRDRGPNSGGEATELAGHGLEVVDVAVHQVGLLPVLLDQLLLRVLLDVLVSDGIQVPSLLLRELTEVSIRDVALVASVKVLEDVLQLAHLELDSQVVQGLLELVERDTVVEVHIEESVRLGQASELLVDLDPKQVKNLLKRTTLNGHLTGGWAGVDVGGQDVPHVATLVSGILLLFLGQVEEQVANLIDLVHIDHVSDLSLSQNETVQLTLKKSVHLVVADFIEVLKRNVLVIG